ncbi:DotI/IcmL family type IV secretion protein [Legionella oakridgensis]|uniref:DotI/IcmL family type IV secretion protein n=1 Tax=Legionella oakridgensis TaxID=29423 RepID=UPI0003DE1F3A|nr:DotI/IcmL family type IV secretion protein [Legionella oakridgensis]ETO94457.1 macrophage killing protein with similarity to conjugation protein [Legionella oakridgensis RV-2-2007]
MSYPRILLICIALLLPLQMHAAPDNTQLAVWVNEAIVATYTYNYQNYLDRQKEIAKYFTANGWIAYSKALNDSKLPDAVQKNSYFVSAVATMPPQVKSIRDNYWEASMPLLVVYKNPQYQQKQTLGVTINFTIVPSGQGVRGLAITSLQSKIIEPPCKCAATVENNHSNTPTGKSPQ